MTDDVIVRIDGLKELVADIYGYSKKMGRKVSIDALKVGGRIIQNQAKKNAPKRTGRLRRGIVLRTSKINKPRRNGKIGVYIGLRTGKGRDDKKDAFYGRFVEQGWNVKGRSQQGNERSSITAKFGKRTGRKTLPGRKDVRGDEYIHKAYMSKRNRARKEIIKAFFLGGEIIKRGTRLK